MFRDFGLKVLRTTDPKLLQGRKKKKWTSFLFLKISSKRKSKAVLLFMLKFPFSVYLYFIHLKKKNVLKKEIRIECWPNFQRDPNMISQNMHLKVS